MRRGFVLLSGGIDSTTCLYMAYNEMDAVRAISIYYGQRHNKEIQYAKQSCEPLLIEHSVIDLSAVVPQTMLTDANVAIPSVSYAEIKGVSPTYVPFRNGLMLSAVASYVSGLRQGSQEYADEEWFIYFGAHAEDAQGWAYPDCTPEFTGAMANAIYVGTYHQIRLLTPLQYLRKYEIVQKGHRLLVDWTTTWSCYAGGEVHCGTCPTCRARKGAFDMAGIQDPTEYAT